MRKSTQNVEMEQVIVEPVKTSAITLAIIGRSPLIMNAMSQKSREELLMPRGRKTAAERRSTIKHDPIREFRESLYLLDDAPTAIGVMATALKGAMMTAALDVPGATKAQVGRLIHVDGLYIPVYGLPRLYMSVVRSADAKKTPDVRTRAIVHEWCAFVTVRYVASLVNATTVANLLAAGGLISGIGDWRPEKGKGTYGQYDLVSTPEQEAQVQRLVRDCGREAQIQAIEHPVAYDRETAKLMERYADEMMRRGK